MDWATFCATFFHKLNPVTLVTWHASSSSCTGFVVSSSGRISAPKMAQFRQKPAKIWGPMLDVSDFIY
jgi:hypothetical protein